MREPWWKLANGLQRGCYLQLLLLCKDGADNGHLCYKNVTELSVLLSIDVRTTRKVVTFLRQNCCINVPKSTDGLFRIFVPKYVFYQELDARDHAKHIQTKDVDSPPKSVLPDQTILNQTRPDQSKSETDSLDLDDLRKQPPNYLSPTDLIESYNAHCPSLRTAREVKPNTKRWNQLNARIKEEPTLAFWVEYFRRCERSNFLAGRCKPGKDWDKPFTAGIDWITGPVNFLQILEGKHDNGDKPKPEKVNAGHTSGKTDYGNTGRTDL